MTLAERVTIRGRFHRSVSLSRDWSASGIGAGYVLTPALRELATYMLGELSQEGGARAWSITGPYGSGKSAFGLFLAGALCGRASSPAATEVRNAFDAGSTRFEPILLTAERAPLEPALRRALNSAARAKANRHEPISELLTRAAKSVRRRRRSGIVLVIDELGKFLEHAALHPRDADVYLLQQLAEAAAGSEVPILLVTILHSGFSDYLPAEEELRRSEWLKVQGRFHDVPFQLPGEQVLELVGNAIQLEAADHLQRRWEERFSGLLGMNEVGEALSRRPGADLLRKCLPLHPLTAVLLWPLFRSKGAQNERSLFAFLASEEPHGFRDFLRQTDVDGSSSKWFSVSDLYDYVASSLGVGLFRGEQAARWSVIEHALSRLPADAPRYSTDVVKVTGLLGLFGQQIGLAASPAVLRASIEDNDAVEAATRFLVERSVLLFRAHTGAFALWEGSDFDLEQARGEALRLLAAKGRLPDRLNRLLPVRPAVPRAHYIRTGTLRYFDVVCCEATPGGLTAAVMEPTAADGHVLYAIPEGSGSEAVEASIRTANEWLSNHRGKPVLVAVVREPEAIQHQLRDVEAWEWVLEHRLELATDQIARREVQARVLEARGRLAAVVGPVLGLPGYVVDLGLSYWAGGEKALKAKSQGGTGLQQLLSNVCDEVFGLAPELSNELLNRHSLSSAASAARRTLIERMLLNAAEERLGIVGNPPEASMYESMLRASGLHAERRGAWGFGPPNGKWAGVWDAVDRFLAEAREQRRGVQDLFAMLQSQPFGMRAGPLPVLLTAVLLAKGDAVALYEDGVFVPELRIETLERLIRRPETFELRSYDLTKAELATLREVMAFVETSVSADRRRRVGGAILVSTVRSLVLLATGLPAVTRQTRRFKGDHTTAVRDQLLGATDPARLMFVDLPVACGIAKLTKAKADVFADRLGQAIKELGRFYTTMLEDLEAQITSTFRLSRDVQAARQQLRQRAEALEPIASEPRMVVFVKEAIRAGAQGNWVESLGRALNGGLPPTHWKDNDLSQFQARLRETAAEFFRLEELASLQRQSGVPAMLRFGLLSPGHGEKRVVIPIRNEDEPEVARLAQQFAGALEVDGALSPDDQRIRLEALGRVAAQLLGEVVTEEVSE